MSRKVIWGTVTIPAEQVIITQIDQRAPAYAQSTQTSRTSRLGIQDYEISTLHQGEGVIRGDIDSLVDTESYQSSQGLIAHIKDGLFLPYILNTTTFFATSSSGNQATADYISNLRVHAVNTNLGQNALRLHMFRKTSHYRNTSDSDATPEKSGLALTNNVTSVGEGVFNSTKYLVICTDGSTNDVSGTTDPTASTPTLATLLSLNADDSLIYRFMPQLGPGYNIFIGKYKGTKGVWAIPTDQALDTAPSQVPLTATTSESDTSNPIESAGPVAPTDGFSIGTTGLAGGDHWQNPGYITTNNASLASATWQFGGSITAAALVAVFDFRALIPPTCDITGIEDSLTGKSLKNNSIGYLGLANNLNAYAEDNRGNGKWNGAFTVLSENRGGEVSLMGASLVAATIGGATSMWGAALTADIVRSPDFAGFYLGLPSHDNAGSVDFGVAGISYWTRKVYFRRKGDVTSAQVPIGGSFGAVDPTDQNTIYILAPEFTDDTSAITVPRILWQMTFAYDSTRQTPTVTISKVDTGLSNVENCAAALGGIVVIGETTSNRNKAMVLVKGGSITDLFAAIPQGFTEDWGVVNLWPQGESELIFDMELSDNSVVQTFIYKDGFIHPIGKRQTITATSLRFAGEGAVTLNPALRNRYRFNPSGSDLVIARAFHPENADADPIYNYTSQTLESGPLSVTLPELNIFGPEEAAKAILTARAIGRNISATNTVKLEYSTDHGSTFTTWATFTSFNQKSTLSAAVSFQTLVLRISLAGNGTDTACGLPLLIEGVSQWKGLRRWQVIIDPSTAAFQREYPGGIDALWSALATLQASSPIQALDTGSVTPNTYWASPGLESVVQASDQPGSVAGQTTNGQHSASFEELP